jgi:hypothetical protein
MAAVGSVLVTSMSGMELPITLNLSYLTNQRAEIRQLDRHDNQESNACEIAHISPDTTLQLLDIKDECDTSEPKMRTNFQALGCLPRS